ncbi:helix-turn-helix transcriptional regulator [Actinomadura barringtoniae]|uniref:Helix-turn-helix transcriptional regulator n=1 Tax=Actinomadura barringtoniae TaxID=1427535 RepID=A0A939P7I4_9ACTN|nr:LuxR C-terminal-related transcriptional regulator [Actinomadura barringtoniae]MBO2447207.1 helix-turn-helix transcriptional regulator [Actinomadura barringtoniae]
MSAAVSAPESPRAASRATSCEASGAGPARRRVALAGDWSRTGIAGELAEHYDVVPVEDAAAVDWLLVGPAMTARSAARVAAELRVTSPALRVARVVPAGRWHDARDCEVRVPDTAGAADVVAALRLAQEGIAITGGPPVGGQGLTDREAELLRALCAGLGNEQIARRMRISRRTVEFHLTRIFRKLGVGSRVEAIIHVQRNSELGFVHD